LAALDKLDKKEDIVLIEQSQDASEGNNLAAQSMNPDDIKFAYCTEFLVELNKSKAKPGQSQDAEGVLRDYLPTLGDSVVVIEDEGLVKVHVHTNHPGKALEKCLQFGQLLNIKIENMRAQHTEMLSFSESSDEPVRPTGPPKPVGIVAVVAGKGMAKLFKELGADYVIEGGQTMNPSADDIVKAIEWVNAEHVVVLPNNKNIILAAEQAGKLTKSKEVHVMATLSIPQGVSCMVANADTVSIDDNIAGMKAAMEAVHSGQITQAVRDTVLDGHQIKKDDFLCIYDGDIALVKKDLKTAAQSLADYMMAQGGEIVSVYYGEGATEASAAELSAYILKNHKYAEVEIYEGKQPLYSYILSVE